VDLLWEVRGDGGRQTGRLSVRSTLRPAGGQEERRVRPPGVSIGVWIRPFPSIILGPTARRGGTQPSTQRSHVMTRHARPPRTAFLALIGLGSLAFAPAQAPAPAQDAALASRVRERMQRFIDRGEIPGAVTLVGNADGVLSLEAIGRRDIEGDQPMRPDT